MSVLDNMLKAAKVTREDFARATKSAGGGLVRAPKRSVERTAELDRILALPRRNWESKGEEWAKALTDYLRTPQGQQRLRPIQAAALVEIHDYRGGLLPIRVGGGKTLVSLLSFLVLESKRPVLLLPAKLIEKTQREMQALRRNWVIPGYVRLISYELLGRAQHAQLLEEAQPDVIVCDEAHKLKNTSAAVTRRVKRYMEKHPDTVFVAMSGTITKRSLHDYAHLSQWALKALNPTPHSFQDRMAWSMVLDERKKNEERLAPGALVELCTDEERQRYAAAESYDEAVAIVRRAFRRRVTDTPGVVGSQDGALGVSLRIDNEIVRAPRTDAPIATLRTDWMRPDGEPLMDGIELWRHLRELACGFYYRWNPPPPDGWLEARRAWAKFVREVLKTNRIGLDSESQVAKAVDDGRYPGDVLRRWRAVRGSYTPITEAVWVDDTVLRWCIEWMKNERGIVWVEHVEFGRALSHLSKVPFYQRGGRDEAGKPIELHPPGTPMIASISSNAEGRNLQSWSANLITSPPTSGQIWEQLLGRTHRDGQQEDEVSCTLLTVIPEQIDAFDRASRDARYISDSTGQEQKLCYADVTIQRHGA